MTDHKIVRCDCGFRFRAQTQERQVAEVRRHAWEAHRICFSTDEALAVLLRLELDDAMPADLSMVEDTARGKEQG